MTPALLADPTMRLFAIVALVLVLKMALTGFYTSSIRIRRRVYATPEDYAFQGIAAKGAPDADVERVRRAHQNDLENILPFLPVGFFFALIHPPYLAAEILMIAFAVGRILHTIFYVRSMQPHRTIAFTVANVASGIMLVWTLVALVRM